MTSHVKIYHHPLDTRNKLIKFLAPYMSTCIALFRRLQFENFTPASHLLSSLSPEDLTKSTEPNKPWIIAFVDRTSRPETEVWITASWETSVSTDNTSYIPQASPLLKSLVQEIQSLGLEAQDVVPAAVKGSGDGTVVEGTKGVDRSQYEAYLNNSNIILFGSVHETTIRVLDALNLLAKGFVGADIPYRKYLFDLSNPVKAKKTLPEGLIWGKVKPEHFSLVKSRTQIPRQDRTLVKLPSVAIFDTATTTTTSTPNSAAAAVTATATETGAGTDGQTQTQTPIAWTFLGPDASLTTLHVEPSHRSRGLAKTLSAKIFAEDMDVYLARNADVEGTEVAQGYAHADVAVDNVASRGVCEGLGGEWGFLVYWVRVDLGLV